MPTIALAANLIIWIFLLAASSLLVADSEVADEDASVHSTVQIVSALMLLLTAIGLSTHVGWISG